MENRPIYGIGHTSQLIPPNPGRKYFDHQGHPFEPQLDEFQMRTAWWLAEAALLAYCESEFVKIQFENADFKFKAHYYAKKTDTDCYVAFTDNYVIVAFRGTEFISFNEWLWNFKFMVKDWPNGGKVHSGFNQGLKLVWEEGGLGRDLAKLRDEDGKNRTFWFTGHSLGAAIATLAADRFYHESKEKTEQDFIGLYTFGSPRVGNKDFKKDFFIKTAFRFVNNRDIVTRIPPWFLFRYTHVGELKYIDRKGIIHKKAPGLVRRFIDRCLGPVWGRREDENRKYLLTFFVYLFLEPGIDHAPVFYSNRIWNFNLKNSDF